MPKQDEDTGDARPAAKFAARRVPVVGPTLAGLMNPESERDRRLREPEFTMK
jgi:hypothetical protein